MTGGSHIEFELGYSYFYHTRSSSNYPAGSNVIQTINISLVPANDNFAGVLFYSKTDSSVQLLEVSNTQQLSLCVQIEKHKVVNLP